ncbi:hypothetical protein [Parvicella tangerina]|uniref:Uncharacterized protein n=1 Tax=Parvicella tangerina TaxID=2829795 RepID=A0A916NFV2_9FLAO|nr:hypothetical protein [Parvicella tangerina]CAG5078662.1 hypothetical protein CRYO30217_00734 [Parvicella tangerina]
MEYKSITDIVKRLSDEIEKLENGEMNVEELEGVLNDVRALHERIAILQYLAIQPIANNKKAAKPSSFSFGVDQSMLDSLREPSNQTNLLDAIEQQGFPKSEILKEEIQETKSEVTAQEDVVKEETEDKTEVPSSEVSGQAESKSLNDKFSDQQEKESLAQKLGKKPISDLGEAIGLNQKFLFMNDLFEGENNLYKEAINTLNNFNSYFEADEYINMLSSKHGWDSTSKSVKDLIELVERRYS